MGGAGGSALVAELKVAGRAQPRARGRPPRAWYGPARPRRAAIGRARATDSPERPVAPPPPDSAAGGRGQSRCHAPRAFPLASGRDGGGGARSARARGGAARARIYKSRERAGKGSRERAAVAAGEGRGGRGDGCGACHARGGAGPAALTPQRPVEAAGAVVTPGASAPGHGLRARGERPHAARVAPGPRGAEPRAMAEPEPRSEPESRCEPEPRREHGSRAELQSPEPELRGEPEPRREPESCNEPESRCEPDPRSQPEAEPDEQAEPPAEPERLPPPGAEEASGRPGGAGRPGLGPRYRPPAGGGGRPEEWPVKKKHRRRPSKKKRRWKPYSKLSWEEKQQFDERQSLRASRLRAEMFAKGQPVAPYNTTQFLMEDHDQEEPDLKTGLYPRRAAAKSDTSEEDFLEEAADEDGGSDGMGGDGSEFLQRDFSETYERYHVESLQNMSKQELVKEYLELEKCLSRMEEENNRLRLESKKHGGEAEAARVRQLELEVDRLRAENLRLLRERDRPGAAE
ncbi:protein HEXIM1 [Cuculus canorus]|nr:protein HEXIM1 [Cuculus canorus]